MENDYFARLRAIALLASAAVSVSILVGLIFLAGCDTPTGKAGAAILDALGEERLSKESASACFTIEDYTARQRCRARYDDVHRYDDLTR